MSTRSKALMVCFFIMMVLTSSAFAGYDKAEKKFGFFLLPEQIIKSLDLNNKQTKKINKINHKYNKKIVKYEKKLAPLELDINNFEYTENSGDDFSELKELMKKANELREDIKVTRMRQLDTIKKVLTPDQVAQIKDKMPNKPKIDKGSGLR